MYARLYGALIEAIVLYDSHNKHLKMYLQQAIDLYQECEAIEELDSFLAGIQKINQSLYDDINWNK